MLLVAAIAAVVVAVGWFLTRTSDTATGGEVAMLVSDRGVVHLVEEGREVERENRAADNDATRPIFISESEASWAPVVDGAHILFSSSAGQEVLTAWRPGEAPVEIFASTGRIVVTAWDDRLFIVEQRGENERCYAGRPDEVQTNRLFRGHDCSFTSTGTLVTNDELRDGFAVDVYAPDGDHLFSDELAGPGRLTSDGLDLVVQSDIAFELIRVETGEVLLDLEPSSADGISRRVLTLDGTTAVLSGATGASFDLDIADAAGVQSMPLGDGRVAMRFAPNGDLWVFETDLDGVSTASRWNPETRALDDLAVIEAAEALDATNRGLLVRAGAPGSQILFLVDESGETELADITDGAVIEPLTGDDVYIFETISDLQATTLMDLSTMERVTTRGWDGLEVLAHRPGVLVVAGAEGDDEIPVVLDLEQQAAIEIEPLRDVVAAALVGDTVLVSTRDSRTETLPYDRRTGEAIPDYDHDGFEVVPQLGRLVGRSGTLVTETYLQVEPCVERGLRRFRFDQQIDIASGETVCLFGEGPVEITIAAPDGVDPSLLVEVGEQRFSNDDVARDDISARVDVTVEGVALVTGTDELDGEELIVVARSADS